MRELKFRAWDTKELKYLWPWPEGFNLFGEVTCFDCISEQVGGLLELNRVEIEQFTGLRDIKGKEIYEGDKVKCIMQTNGQMCEGIVEWNTKYAAYTIRAITGESFVDNLADCRVVEVIGNIHEN